MGKIKLSELQYLVDVENTIQSLESLLVKIDDELQCMVDDPDYKVDSSSHLKVYLKRQHNKPLEAISINLPPALIEKLLKKESKQLKLKIKELKSLFADEETD